MPTLQELAKKEGVTRQAIWVRTKKGKEYRKSPKYKEYQKEYRKSPKYKEHQKEYQKEYRKSPKYKEHQKEYYLKIIKPKLLKLKKAA